MLSRKPLLLLSLARARARARACACACSSLSLALSHARALCLTHERSIMHTHIHTHTYQVGGRRTREAGAWQLARGAASHEGSLWIRAKSLDAVLAPMLLLIMMMMMMMMIMMQLPAGHKGTGSDKQAGLCRLQAPASRISGQYMQYCMCSMRRALSDARPIVYK